MRDNTGTTIAVGLHTRSMGQVVVLILNPLGGARARVWPQNPLALPQHSSDTGNEKPLPVIMILHQTDCQADSLDTQVAVFSNVSSGNVNSGSGDIDSLTTTYKTEVDLFS